MKMQTYVVAVVTGGPERGQVLEVLPHNVEVNEADELSAAVLFVWCRFCSGDLF